MCLYGVERLVKTQRWLVPCPKYYECERVERFVDCVSVLLFVVVVVVVFMSEWVNKWMNKCQMRVIVCALYESGFWYCVCSCGSFCLSWLCITRNAMRLEFQFILFTYIDRKQKMDLVRFQSENSQTKRFTTFPIKRKVLKVPNFSFVWAKRERKTHTPNALEKKYIKNDIFESLFDV